MRIKSSILSIVLSLAWLASLALAAEPQKPFVHPLFSDHAVLQRDIAVPVWGWAQAGAKVRVAMAGKTAEATAGADGRWMAKIGPFAAGGPHKLEITGPQNVTVNDILVGDVWLCSGQSNMEMGIGACNVQKEIDAANYPQIRLLTVPKRVAGEPVDVADISWAPCTPQTVAAGGWGGFSAAGYFFGRELHRELNVPIGLIHSSWGGTIAEAWTSREGLLPLKDFDGQLEDLAQAVASEKAGGVDYAARLETWFKAADPGTAQGWQKPDADVSAWKKVQMPAAWEQAGLPDYDGIAWLRREFDAPANWAGKELVLNLCALDATWINGTAVGGDDRWTAPRAYRVPAGLVKPGRNVIAIRVLDTGGAGGMVGNADQMHIGPRGDDAAAVALAGAWLLRGSTPLAQLTPRPARLGGNPNVTTVLYNGMIAPILPYAIKGAIWYQGESNANRAVQYQRLLPAMIADWRNRFGVGEFHFYIVQLAAFMPTHPEPRDNDWAELREAQALTAKNFPNCGLAVAIDIGDAADIHPKDKLSVGRRLALAALGQAYKKDIVYSGPWYKSMKATDKGLRIEFDHVGGGLVARGDKLTGFAIAGEDRKFVWADAVIEGNSVVVSSPKVAKPVAVRYAWDVNPVCNLFNKEGLPAVPFRTDDWPLITRDRK